MQSENESQNPSGGKEKLRNAIETVVGELSVDEFTIHYNVANNGVQYLTLRTSEKIPGVEKSPIETYDLSEEGVVPRQKIDTHWG